MVGLVAKALLNFQPEFRPHFVLLFFIRIEQGQTLGLPQNMVRQLEIH